MLALLTSEHPARKLYRVRYRGLYHFYVARQQGKATDPREYFAALENRDLGIVKSQRKPNVKLIVAPFPDRQRGNHQFFARYFF